jgi:hypothetical protein
MNSFEQQTNPALTPDQKVLACKDLHELNTLVKSFGGFVSDDISIEASTTIMATIDAAARAVNEENILHCLVAVDTPPDVFGIKSRAHTLLEERLKALHGVKL